MDGEPDTGGGPSPCVEIGYRRPLGPLQEIHKMGRSSVTLRPALRKERVSHNMAWMVEISSRVVAESRNDGTGKCRHVTFVWKLRKKTPQMSIQPLQPISRVKTFSGVQLHIIFCCKFLSVAKFL